MKTKFNILCGLMVLAIIGAMTTLGGTIGKEDVEDFKDGYEQGWESARETSETDGTGETGTATSRYTFKWQYMDVIPDDANADQTLYDTRNGEEYDVHVSSKHISVKVDSASPAADACATIGLILTELALLLFWATFIRFIFMVNKGAFNEDQIKRMKMMGWCAIAVYPAKWLAVGIPAMIFRNSVSFEGYEISPYMPQLTWLIVGFGLLMFSLIMKMGMEIKQEQDLTI